MLDSSQQSASGTVGETTCVGSFHALRGKIFILVVPNSYSVERKKCIKYLG